MSDPDPADDGGSGSLASSRSRRGPSKKRDQRTAALEKLKAAKKGKWEYEVGEEMTDGVYEVVDEKEYAEKVRERRDAGFIVDDDGEG